MFWGNSWIQSGTIWHILNMQSKESLGILGRSEPFPKKTTNEPMKPNRSTWARPFRITQLSLSLPWILSRTRCKFFLQSIGTQAAFSFIHHYFCGSNMLKISCIIYIYINGIWLLIKIPLSRNGHSSRIKNYFRETFANSMFIFRGAHVGQQHLLWRFVHHLPNYARESRITSW